MNKKLVIAFRRCHQRTGKDGCAEVYLNEIDVANDYMHHAMESLKKKGHTVVDCTPPEANRSVDDSLSYGVNKANSIGADLFISCHVNAFENISGVRGCEVLHHPNSQQGKELAIKLCKEISSLGFNNRKNKPQNFYELRTTNMPSVIIEPFFLDALGDVAIYKKVGARALGEAISNAIDPTTIAKKNTSVDSFLNLDGGSRLYNGELGINLIIRDFSPNIISAFGYVGDEQEASWAFSLNPQNDNYTKLKKNSSKYILKSRKGNFEYGKAYSIRVDGYDREGKVVTSRITLQTVSKDKLPQEEIKIDSEPSSEVENNTIYKIQLGAFRNKEYMEKEKEKIESKGFKTYIVENKE